LIAVDTSVWIDFFRGKTPTADKLLDLLDKDQVALPVPVRIEILSGARQTEHARLRRVLSALPLLLPDDSTWAAMERWAIAGAAAGQRFGVGDLLVAAIASQNDCAIWSLDDDFVRMSRLGFVSLAD
jgi:predicted nucleic acid-binding protein